ncbi:MAG: hypothetical protein NVSMB20_06870 [Bradyrhizobium sp.]
MPGYGYASAPKAKVASWTALIHQFLQGRSSLARVYVLIDGRHGLKEVDLDVLNTLDKSKKLIPELSVKDARRLIADGTISGGMIPKVETCIYALEQGVRGVVIIDGKIPHAVLLELFTNQGTGTLIHK